LVHATRNTQKYLGRLAPYIEYGASPRASIAFTNAGRALAMIRGRNYVIPEDIKDLAHPVLAHRIQRNFKAPAENITSAQVVDALLMAVPTP
ncbi:AAA family ATPase, partial [Burkholderia multivorans]|uniref:AAA family ATPase n=1 Tax=Burkholderia multivorans TaxID=87883 RepID=UPI000DB72494